MKILIGILAHNEEEIISQTLKSLFSQDIFFNEAYEIKIIVLANGCSDNTVDIAKTSIEKFNYKLGVKYEVIDKKTPGKINAWNDIIHKHSSGQEKYIIFMDGDIIIQEKNNLSTLVESLNNKPHALISTDQPIKDIEFKNTKSIRYLLSLAFSKITRKGQSQLSAQLYCARAQFLKDLYMPAEVLIDDTYLKFMACTNGLTSPIDHSKIIVNNDVSHIFEAYTDLKDYFDNQVRQVAGFSLWRIFKKIINDDLKSYNAIEAVKKRYLSDPLWLQKEMQKYFTQNNRKWFIYDGALKVRFKRLGRLSLLSKIIMFMPTCVAWLIDLAAFIKANHKLKKLHLNDLWSDTKSKKLNEVNRPLTSIQKQVNN